MQHLMSPKQGPESPSRRSGLPEWAVTLEVLGWGRIGAVAHLSNW